MSTRKLIERLTDALYELEEIKLELILASRDIVIVGDAECDYEEQEHQVSLRRNQVRRLLEELECDTC